MATAPAKSDAQPSFPGLWGTILTTTPVVLTVLATILAGLSSSEMTQAQYHRSLAAQYQSKAGDQWGFFQAKRIRGSALETSADHLPPTAPLDPARVKALAHRLTVALEQTAKESGLSDDVAKRLTEESKNSEESLVQELDTPQVGQAFTFLTADKLPAIAEHAIDQSSLDPALNAIRDRKSDEEVDKLVTVIPDKLVVTALEAAENNAQACDDAGKPIGKTLDHVSELVNRHAARADSFLSESAQDPATGADRANKENTAASDAQVTRAAQKLHETFAAARDRFNAHRYRREADYNQKIAFLHEVQVHKSSVNSDRHRQRSLHFFFGMLGAQAGVAVSSMALAARQKSVLWGLAGVLGLAALAFSGYVYLYY